MAVENVGKAINARNRFIGRLTATYAGPGVRSPDTIILIVIIAGLKRVLSETTSTRSNIVQITFLIRMLSGPVYLYVHTPYILVF